MKAIRFYPPGGPEQLRLENLPIPSNLKPNEVLIKVHSASVIWPELTWPIYQDQATGEHHPHIVCHDFSGTVVRTGADVDSRSDIRVGSEVYAFTSAIFSNSLRVYEGAAAEYAVADVDSVLPKPKNMSLQEAATVPLSALTAWQALHDQTQAKKGQRLLVAGAATITGLWVVQIAKLLGMHVIGTASSEWSFKTLKDLGTDQIIDYKKQSVTDLVKDVDIVLDAVGGAATLEQAVSVLKPEGQILSLVNYTIQEDAPKGVKAKFFIVSMNKEELVEIGKLIEEGKLKTFIDSVYPLEKTVEAFKKGKEGHLQGKIVLSVASE
jgi:NADPH:quinone reductase-like Zn-dependent oxidoreductase